MLDREEGNGCHSILQLCAFLPESLLLPHHRHCDPTQWDAFLKGQLCREAMVAINTMYIHSR